MEEKINKYLNEKDIIKKGEEINIPSGFGDGMGIFQGYDKKGNVIVDVVGDPHGKGMVFSKREIKKINPEKQFK